MQLNKLSPRLQQIIREEKEQVRLMKPSGFHCPECAEPMSQGEYEAGGLCTNCYFDTVRDYP